MGWNIIMFQKNKKEIESTVVGACTVQSSIIFPESQMLPTMAGPTPFCLLGVVINMQFLAYAEPLWKLEKVPFLDRCIQNQSTWLGPGDPGLC